LCHGTFVSARGLAALAALDDQNAARVHAGGCLLCRGALHRADYPRKPRGSPKGVDGHATESRTSFCCAERDCRKRATPPSLRYFDRRVYLSLFITLAAVLVNGATARRVREVARSLDVDRRTLERWRAWWIEQLPRSSVWQSLRARLDRPVDESCLPASLLARITGVSDDDRHQKLLGLLHEFSHSALMRARFAMAR